MSLYPEGLKPVTDPLCQAGGCRTAPFVDGEEAPPTPRQAVRGTGLCLVHHARFAEALRELVHRWQDLEHALYRSSKGPANSGVQTSGVADLSSSWNPYASEVMADIEDWAAYLVRLVVAFHPVPESEVRVKTITRTVVDPETKARTPRPVALQTQHIDYVHALDARTPAPLALATLARHYARWLSGYPGETAIGPILLADVLRFHTQARAAVQQDPVRRVGTKDGMLCGEQVDGPGLELLACDAPLSVLLDGYGRPGDIVCSRHPRTHRVYRPDEWMEWTLGG